MNGKINNWKWVLILVVLATVIVACSKDEPTAVPEVAATPETVIQTITESLLMFI